MRGWGVSRAMKHIKGPPKHKMTRNKCDGGGGKFLRMTKHTRQPTKHDNEDET